MPVGIRFGCFQSISTNIPISQGDICRCPLIARMLIVKSVKNTGTTRWDPKINNRDHLFKEVEGERKRALQYCAKIMKHLDLTWDQMEEEIRHWPSDGNWNSPGEKVDLHVLLDDVWGAL